MGKFFCFNCNYLFINFYASVILATARLPWPNFSNDLAALFHVATSKDPPPIPEHLSSNCKSLIFLCMKIDPKSRPSAKEFLSHPYLVPVDTANALNEDPKIN